ncbi:hypothetical protein JQX09_23535 [Sulfitobacter pseudonitzschiae]|uniref:Uncharacterized protein n=1 Tax=Pseudosulfitobacter pseudonitzschiae TaxID=1402135 RepID=A0A9Q2S2T6_9RHOB|nr:hypothetical protein [Pseudosulfitobacter pseudonitzschiae]MBM2294905.1 hypothetical protein [Pseudosulfitobacter pseudonitzschiae]MBM2299821.1 hypothetical protein [Pseudosulfitobacter pseudonitzschiae]MBM2304742.1 hypothetical protein [Pseudosulfitobacter pseudonitzschiae]MBM2314516.1 hypothetical protein [Pseudosulfitobacter pseudonitzschiae]MBM2319426.1 hypothetical protein [Pseudosulfitobacter pseudonitzschiae]
MKQRLGYIKALYEIPVSDLWSVHAVMGIYILRSSRRIYCGLGSNLANRIPNSLREQGFGEFANYFTEELLYFPKDFRQVDFMSVIEANTISALHTIIWGNGLPLRLTNKQHALLLPGAAWNSCLMLEYKLSIEIAQTVLYRMGVPRRLTELPAYMSDFPTDLGRHHAARWKDIIADEVCLRKKAECPLFVMHPA